MSIREDVELYTKLSGEDGSQETIGTIGAYLRGYGQGKEDAERERKRGKWIEYEQEFMLEESLKTVQKTVRECSVCTAKIAGMVGIMNYCPNCGAKMERRTVAIVGRGSGKSAAQLEEIKKELGLKE